MRMIAILFSATLFFPYWAAAELIDFGSSFALNSNAISDLGDDTNPQIATDGEGQWVVVWESGESLGEGIGTDSDILVTYSDDNGDTWANSIPLNSNANGDTNDDTGPK